MSSRLKKGWKLWKLWYADCTRWLFNFYYYYYRWLLYSAVLYSRANSLHSRRMWFWMRCSDVHYEAYYLTFVSYRNGSNVTKHSFLTGYRSSLSSLIQYNKQVFPLFACDCVFLCLFPFHQAIRYDADETFLFHLALSNSYLSMLWLVVGNAMQKNKMQIWHITTSNKPEHFKHSCVWRHIIRKW